MPTAQGHITVKRRPKDGTDGLTIVVTPSNIEFHYEKGEMIQVHVDVYRGNEKLLYNSGYTCSSLSSSTSVPISEGLAWRFTVDASGGFYYTLLYSSIHDVNINIPFTVTVDGMQYSRAICVKTVRDGKDGDDAERCWLVPSATSVHKSASNALSPTSVSCSVMRQIGSSDAEPVTDMFVTYQSANTNGLSTTEQKYTPGGQKSVSASAKLITFRLYRSGSVVNTIATGEGDVLDTVTIPVVSDGTTGPQGLQGCIYRRTKFATGFRYHNDSALTTDGIRYIDLVYIMRDSTMLASHALWFRCKKTHDSNSDNAPQATNTGNEPWLEYWEPLNTLEPIYTPLLVADDAVITLLQSNQIVVMKEDGSTVNAALGGGKYPFWIGDINPQSGKFCIDDEGRVLSGVSDGQRVEIQPDNKAIKIYDNTGVESSSFEGNSYTTLDSLFGDLSGSFTMADKKKGSMSVSGSSSIPVNVEYKVSNAINSPAPIEVIASGYLQTYCSKAQTSGLVTPDIVDGASSGLGELQSGVNTTLSTNHANASISLYVNTYSDSALTTRLGSVLIASCRGTDSKTLTNVRAKTSAGGYHVLVVEVRLNAVGAGQSAWAKWGSTVSGKADISATYTSDFYVSRYFSNGFCLGQSRTDYIWAYNQGSSGMRFIMESGGYGIDVTKQGVKYKHHGGRWMNMPMLVFHGRAYNINSNGSITYAWTSQSSFNNTTPTLSRASEGMVRIIFPNAWINAGITPSACIINVTGFGSINGSSTNPIKAQIYEILSNYVTISLSDDETVNDGSFMIQIYAI